MSSLRGMRTVGRYTRTLQSSIGRRAPLCTKAVPARTAGELLEKLIGSQSHMEDYWDFSWSGGFMYQKDPRGFCMVDIEEDLVIAVAMMQKNDVGSLVCTRKGVVKGILTERDYLTMVAARRLSPVSMSVQDIMTVRAHLTFIDDQADLDECIAFMAAGGFRRLPVLKHHAMATDKYGRPYADKKLRTPRHPKEEDLVGMITVREVIGELAEAYENKTASESAAAVRKHPVGEILTEQSRSRWSMSYADMFEHFTISIEAPLDNMVDEMCSAGVGSQVVMNAKGEEIVGIVTERDYLRKVAALREPASTIEEIMTPVDGVTCLHKDATVKDAMKVMAENGTRHLPVIDDNGALLGLLSIRDILLAIKDEGKLMVNPGELNIHTPSKKWYGA